MTKRTFSKVGDWFVLLCIADKGYFLWEFIELCLFLGLGFCCSANKTLFEF